MTDLLPEMLFPAFLLVVVVALASLVATLFFWRSVEHLYIAGLPRFFIAVAEIVSGLGGMFSVGLAKWPASNLATQAWLNEFFGIAWNRTLLVAVLSWILWEAVSVVAEHRHGQSVKLARELNHQLRLRIGLLTSLRQLVNEKRKRIEHSLQGRTDRRCTVQRIRGALKVGHQIYMLLEHLALFLQNLHRDQVGGDTTAQNFRIGLYVEEDGYLWPWMTFDLNDRKAQPFSSYEVNKARFRIDSSDRPSQVVQCLRERRLLITPDCASSADQVFGFFHAGQASYLKSLVTYPILDFGAESGTICRAALAIDTNVPNYFREEDRQEIESFVDEFAARLNLESHFLAMVKE